MPSRRRLGARPVECRFHAKAEVRITLYRSGGPSVTGGSKSPAAKSRSSRTGPEGSRSAGQIRAVIPLPVPKVDRTRDGSASRRRSRHHCWRNRIPPKARTVTSRDRDTSKLTPEEVADLAERNERYLASRRREVARDESPAEAAMFAFQGGDLLFQCVLPVLDQKALVLALTGAFTDRTIGPGLGDGLAEHDCTRGMGACRCRVCVRSDRSAVGATNSYGAGRTFPRPGPFSATTCSGVARQTGTTDSHRPGSALREKQKCRFLAKAEFPWLQRRRRSVSGGDALIVVRFKVLRQLDEVSVGIPYVDGVERRLRPSSSDRTEFDRNVGSRERLDDLFEVAFHQEAQIG